MPRLTRVRTLVLALVAPLLTSCGSDPAGPSPAPAPAATRDGRWVQDIEALARDLPRLHANLFFRTSRETFDREVESLKTRVAEMTDYAGCINDTSNAGTSGGAFVNKSHRSTNEPRSHLPGRSSASANRA